MSEANVLNTYRKLLNIIEGVSVGAPHKDSWSRIYTGAALAKCLEFNSASFDITFKETAFFVASGLRGVCEDLIALKYFKEKIDPRDAQDILSAWGLKQMAESAEKQNMFFNSNRPNQPIVPYSDWFQNTLSSSKATLRTYRSKYKWGRDLPRIIDMADACSLRPLYDYLYSATSKSVHFSPHFFLRMGWGDKNSFHFSTKHFAQYYVEFSRFYGTFLFVKLCETFGDDLGISQELADSLMVLQEYMESNPRWPELVTFEELNLAPPNHLMIHSLIPLMEGSSPEERREMIQIVLTERNKERISRMSVEEKRDSIIKGFGGHVSDEVHAIPEDKLDHMLHTLGIELIENIKSDIQPMDAAIVLSGIPPDDLARYFEEIAANESSRDLAGDDGSV